MNTKLAAKVQAVNLANGVAEDLSRVLREFFRPYVGQKIFRSDGSLLKKITDAMPQLEHEKNVQIYKYSSEYNLIYMVKTRINYDEYTCLYHEVGVYIGSVRDGVLLDLLPPFQARTDFTVEEITNARNEHDRLKKLADEALRGYHDFSSF